MNVLLLLVCGAWGVFTALLMMGNISLREKLKNATKIGINALEAQAKAVTELHEAREVFAAQLKRPSAAFFSEEQVVSLSNRLIELLFIPAAQAVKRELSEKKQ